jgi:hypothetical protein
MPIPETTKPDILVRLRDAAEFAVPERTRENLCAEAAAEIKRLRSRIEDLEEERNELLVGLHNV